MFLIGHQPSGELCLLPATGTSFSSVCGELALSHTSHMISGENIIVPLLPFSHCLALSLAVSGFCRLGEAEKLTHMAIYNTHWVTAGEIRHETRCCIKGVSALPVQSKASI